MKYKKLWIIIALLTNFLGLAGIVLSKIIDDEDLLIKSTVFFIIFIGFTIGAFVNYYKNIKVLSSGLKYIIAVVSISLFGNFIITFYFFDNKIILLSFNVICLILFFYFLNKYSNQRKIENEG